MKVKFMSRTFNFIFASIFIYFAFASSLYAQSDPVQCLMNINQAIEDADLEALEEVADIDELITSSLDAFMLEIQKPENRNTLPPILSLLLSQINGGKDNKIRELLLSEGRTFVENGVQSGAFAGKKLSYKQTNGLLAPLFEDASLGKKEIRGIGEPVPAEGDWLVPFSVHDYGNGRDYQIIGRISDTGSGSKLVKIENIDELIQQIKSEAQENY